jgi:peroxiredoxin
LADSYDFIQNNKQEEEESKIDFIPDEAFDLTKKMDEKKIAQK